jgi:hypothetical protein
VKYSDKIRKAQLQAVADALGPAAVMKIFSGDVPQNCDAANPSGEIAEIELPRNPFMIPANGKLMIAEPWSGFSHATETRTAKSFRVYDYLGEVHIQGTISKQGTDGDLQFDTTEIQPGQRIAIGSFTLDFLTDGPRPRELEEA